MALDRPGGRVEIALVEAAKRLGIRAPRGGPAGDEDGDGLAGLGRRHRGLDRCGRLGSDLRWRLELCVLAQDRPLEALELRARVDPELLGQRPAGVAVDAERVGLAARAVKRQHELPAQTLAQRVLTDQRLKLADERGVEAEGEIGLDPLLERGEAQLLEARDFRLRERLVREVGERVPAPQIEGVVEQFGGGRRISGGGRPRSLAELMLEALRVEPVRLDPEQVAAGARQHDLARRSPCALGLERLAKLRDVHLERVRRGLGRPRPPQVVDQAIARNHRVGVQQQDREKRPLLGRSERKRLVLVENLKRSEDPEIHLSSGHEATSTR